MNDSVRNSLIKLVQQSPVIPYDDLQAAFGVPTYRAMENIIVEAIYEGLIDGQLDPKRKVLEVRDWRATVPGPAELKFMRNVLADWMNESARLLTELQEKAVGSNEEAAKIQQEEKQHEKLVDQKRDELDNMPRPGRFEDGRAGRTFKRAKNLAGVVKRGH